ncbi:MAG: flagellar basal body L-ring protein FlgH [Gammaproteobacteria bacterium]|nr:flagellar basal body L-ring protein FlgH [Gammaproteobacteria bacterium]
MKRISLMITMIATLAGCAGAPEKAQHDPNYAPARPVPVSYSNANPGSLFQPGFGNFYTDRKAYRVGDILSMTLTESTNASKSASTSTAKTNEINFENPTILGQPVSLTRPGIIGGGTGDLSLSANSDQAFDGEGSSAQSNSLQGSISVSVMEVLANGYLVVRGEKILSLNQGDEFIRVSGIIRPEDVSPDNTVQSTKVANAQIIYGGTGALADANRDGWMSKFFKKVWPF